MFNGVERRDKEERRRQLRRKQADSIKFPERRGNKIERRQRERRSK